jgi:predicted nucleic acid-binding protein
VILFCAASALIKLVVEEAGSAQISDAARSAECLAVCRIAWAEAMAALAQRSNIQRVNQSELQQARQTFIDCWNDFAIVEVTQPLVEKAGIYADGFALRGYDSVQLAAAHTLQQNLSIPMAFACFDNRLSRAAELLQLEVL